MRRAELRQRLQVGAGRVCVDVREVEHCPGYVRTVTIDRANRVAVDFDVWGMDEAGLYFVARFEALDDAVRCIEQYLGIEFTDWPVVSDADCPARSNDTGTAISHERFKTALREGRVKLPPSEHFRVAANWWKQHLPPGSGYSRSQ